MSSDANTHIDWTSQISMICKRYAAALSAGETIDGLDWWLAQVPEQIRSQLRAELETCQADFNATGAETHVLEDWSDGRWSAESADPESTDAESIRSRSALGRCRAFLGLAANAFTALEAELLPQSFSAGTVLIEQGAPAPGLYLLLSGSVDIMDARTGEQIDCDSAGSVLGEMSLLTGQPCSAQVIATSDVEALVLSGDGYRKLQKDHPELEIALSQLVSDRLGGHRHDALCGKQIDDYRLVHCISRGGMGVVYHAQQVDTGQSVAIKMLRHRFIYDDHIKDRFDQEAEVLGALVHPNIISFQEHFLAYRTRFLVLDLCDGADLFRVLQDHGALDEAQTRAILGQVAEGLCYAHQEGVIHRDLKPGNVLVNRQGQVKITDFGLSKLLASEVLGPKAVGTPAYMPPEQFCSDDASPHCDWYALGCLACEMLTGQMLFGGGSWMEIFRSKRQAIPSDDWPKIDASEELRRVLQGALQPDAKRRYLDLDAMSRWAAPIEGLFD